jgi:hypothetical protein
MSSILRLRVEVRPEPTGLDPPTGWRVTYIPVLENGTDVVPLPPDWPTPRNMAVQSNGEHLFPRLPAGEPYVLPPDIPAAISPALVNYCTGADPAGLDQLNERIIQRQQVPENFDVSCFGRYLFEILLGRPVWKAACNWAAAAGAGVEDILEVALAWTADQVHLHRLNWEMMVGPDGFLAARQPNAPHRIALTRMVLGAKAAPRLVQEVPRYLFAIGAPASDPGIRPGVEFIGLVRGVQSQHNLLDARLLRGVGNRGVTPTELANEVKTFQPHVVHLTCHGKFDDAHSAALSLQPDPKDPAQKTDFDTTALFELLSKGPELPQVIVLSACNTGQASSGRQTLKGSHETAPMAAGLVQNGVPMVVGMAGQVADRACCHFTRRFGEALVGFEPLVAALAEGRWAAFAYGPSAEASVDWAFPALFISEAIPPGFIPIQASQQPKYERIDTWINAWKLKRLPNKEPVFCGRDDIFDAFFRLFEPKSISALVAIVESGRGYGKTRLLEELAMAAFRQGHVPLVLLNNSPTNTYPDKVPGLPGLRRALLTRLEQAVDTYSAGISPAGLPPRPEWTLLDLATDPAGQVDTSRPGLPPEIRNELMINGPALTGRALALALRRDLQTLYTHAASLHPFLRGRPVLLLDDVHLFGPEFVESWFSGDVLSGFGLGLDDASLIPVVMTVSLDGPAGQAAKQIITPLQQKGQALNWLKLLPLGKFSPEKDLDLLLYEQVWLNPFESQFSPDASAHPLTLVPACDQITTWEPWVGLLRLHVGYPLQLSQQTFFLMSAMGLKDKILAPAGEKDLLEKYKDTGIHTDV